MIYQLFDIITIITSIVIAFKNIRRITESSIYIIYYFFFFIYILPLILDYTLGFPKYFIQWDAFNSTYDKYAGFIDSYDDDATRILYDLFIILFQVILLSFQPKASHKKRLEFDKNNIKISKPILILFVFVSLVPILFSLLVGYFYIPFLYGWRENPVLSIIQQGGFYATIERCTYIGLTASLICIMAPRQNILFKILMIAVCYMNISIESKRSIVFFAMAVFILLKYNGFGNKISLTKLAFVGLICISLMVIYSIYVKTSMRGYSDTDQLYTNIRIDMFRDDTARLVIYSFISDMKNVVQYPFQSYLTEISFLFPLDILNGMLALEIPKIGFNTYITSALIGIPITAGEKWMTTSMIDELIANFSILGVFLAPMIFGLISRFVDKTKPFVQVLLLSAILLSFMYSFNYIVYYIQFATIISIIVQRSK